MRAVAAWSGCGSSQCEVNRTAGRYFLIARTTDLAALFIQREVAVRQLKVDSRVKAHHPRSIQRFFRANLRRAARSHFAARQIHDTGAITKRFELD